MIALIRTIETALETLLHINDIRENSHESKKTQTQSLCNY